MGSMRVPLVATVRIVAALLIPALSAPAATLAQGDVDDRCQSAFVDAAAILSILDSSGSRGSLDGLDDGLVASRLASIETGLLDLTILSCPSEASWLEAAADHPAVAGDDGSASLSRRCADPSAGMDGSGACSPSGSPPGENEVEVEQVDLPDIKPRVRGATRTRYYPVVGRSPDELFTQMQVNGSRSCPSHALACVNIQPRIRPLVSTGASGCRVIGVRASLSMEANLPRWAGPDEVYPELVAWWRKVAKRIGAHESEHITIASRHVARLRREIVGKPCASLNAYVARWSRDLTAAQDAFDAKDRERPWPEYDGATPSEGASGG
jgi:predicted secreted Zn-dependent protease